jgi:hypothetical protein
MLTCTCDARCEARKAARTIFQQKLTRMHTPNILTRTICNSMDNWLARRPVLPPAWNGPEEPIQHQIRSAFKAQATIGWDQFFHGRILAKAWSIPIGMYYRIRQPGESFTPAGPVDANSHQGTLGVLDRHMEATKHRIAWY